MTMSKPRREKPPQELPKHVLTRTDFVDACARRDIGAVLKLARQYGGTGFTASHIARLCELTPARVGEYMSGKRKATSVDVIARIADGLRIPGAMLDLGIREWEDAQEEVTVLRRDFLKAGVASALAGAAALTATGSAAAATPTEQRLDRQAIDEARERMARLRKLDDHMGGADTFALYKAEVDLTQQTLRTRSARDQVTRAAMLALLAEQMQQCGWAAFDAGWQPTATDLFSGSFEAAKEARSPDLAGNALALRSYQLVSTGAAGVESTEHSFDLAERPDTHPVVRSLLFQRGAWTHAVNGDAERTSRALGRAEEALQVDRDSAAPDWAAWVDSRTELDIIGGRCWTQLHRPLRAVPALESALASYDDSHGRDKALYSSWLADAYIDAGEPEQAATITGRAVNLASGVASVRPNQRIAEVIARLEEYANSPAVSDLLCRDAVDPLRVRS
jgi:transcriptional regulator with XRE-family HTH domain